MTDKYAFKGRCVWIIDFNHVIHRFFNGMQGVSLSTTVEIERENEYGGTYLDKVVIDTGVFSQVLKSLVSMSSGGVNPMVICHDSVNRTRKAYFKQEIESGGIYSSKGTYKASRAGMNPLWKKSSDLCLTLLKRTGAMVLGKDNYEADDLIAEAVRVAKLQYPDLPICILANDLDLAPLIDEQVSLYKNPTKMTFAFDGYPKVRSYGQVKPENYQRVLEGTTLVKKLGAGAVYNSLLLSKIIRGDSSDNIDCMKGFYRKPQRLKDMIADMQENEPDFPDIFRYYQWETKYRNTSTGELHQHLPQGLTPAEKKLWKIELFPPYERLERMAQVLSGCLDDDEILEFFKRYDGMNLNGAFLHMNDRSLRRKPFVMREDVKIPSLDVALIALEASRFGINIRF